MKYGSLRSMVTGPALAIGLAIAPFQSQAEGRVVMNADNSGIVAFYTNAKDGKGGFLVAPNNYGLYKDELGEALKAYFANLGGSGRNPGQNPGLQFTGTSSASASRVAPAGLLERVIENSDNLGPVADGGEDGSFTTETGTNNNSNSVGTGTPPSGGGGKTGGL